MARISPLTTLKIADFRNYQIGAFLSEIGNQMQIVAVAWQIYELTHNPASLGLVGLANFLPILLFSLIGGLVADKVDRKKLIILALIAQTIFSSFLFLLTYNHQISPIWIYVILFFISISQ